MRPQRQARSSVCYAESVSDDDFTEPISRPSRRKNAVEEPASVPRKKRKERPNPKERAEAMQLERAIRESLNDVADRGYSAPEPSANCSRADPPNLAFQCLLDVTYEDQALQDADKANETQKQDVVQDHCTSRDEQGEAVSFRPNAEAQKEFYQQHEQTGSDDLRAKKEKESEEEQEDDTSEESMGQNIKDDTSAPTKEDPAQVKKRRNTREATKSPGLVSLPHRRVVGLSRRFRPPSLHPYLAG